MALAGVRRRGKGWQAYYRDPSGRERTKMFAAERRLRLAGGTGVGDALGVMA